MKFKIVREKIRTHYEEEIIIRALEESGQEIFGAWCVVYRNKSSYDSNWGEWKIDWPDASAGTFEERLPHFKVIEAGMEELKEKTRYYLDKIKKKGGEL